MSARRLVVWSGLALACAAGSFLATYAVQPQSQPGAPGAPPLGRGSGLHRWLDLTPEQAEKTAAIDPTFVAERAESEAKVAAERARLAELFESEAASDADILTQVERVGSAQNALERRVAEHLLALRPHLTPEQRAKLFARCAQGVRDAGGHRWRHGRDEDAARGRGRGGPPEERGQGRGGRGGSGGGPSRP